jgi:hypothetical protein
MTENLTAAVLAAEIARQMGEGWSVKYLTFTWCAEVLGPSGRDLFVRNDDWDKLKASCVLPRYTTGYLALGHGETVPCATVSRYRPAEDAARDVIRRTLRHPDYERLFAACSERVAMDDSHREQTKLTFEALRTAGLAVCGMNPGSRPEDWIAYGAAGSPVRRARVDDDQVTLELRVSCAQAVDIIRMFK